MLNSRYCALIGMLLAAAATRLMPHPPNFTPIAAMALFGGAHFENRRAAFLIPCAAMLLSDWVLGFHGLMPVVYGSFALTVGLGMGLRDRRSPGRIAAAATFSAVLFFITTNFGVWAFESLYPKTLAGLMTCYTMALPFFRNTLAGTLTYAAILFGAFALAQRYAPALRLSDRSEVLL